MKIDSRDLYELEPYTFAMVKHWLELCKDAGYDVMITSGFRNKERQDEIYNTVTNGRRATNAHGGQSFHNFRVAADFCLKKNGKIDWNDEKGYKACGLIMEKLGGFWGGRWTSLGDNCHVQSDSHSSISASGLQSKYPNGERSKDFTKEDCDKMYQSIYPVITFNEDQPVFKTVTVSEDKPLPKRVQSILNIQAEPIIAEKPSLLGFFKFIVNKVTSKS